MSFARHAPYPGARAARTLWLGLYGSFSPYQSDDRDPTSDPSRPDPYLLFYARSSAMGWLTSATQPEPVRLWGTNEAELEQTEAGEPPLAAWIQVVVTEASGIDGLLPLQPFLACAGDVVERLGTLELEAVQLLLPPPDPSVDDPPGAEGLGRLADAAGWFESCERGQRTPVHITIDSDQVPTVTTLAPEIFDWTQRFVPAATVFNCDGFETSHDAVTILPGIADTMWADAPLHRTTFSGTIVEWSLDALGWTAAFLANSCHRHGVETELVLTATRAAQPPA